MNRWACGMTVALGVFASVAGQPGKPPQQQPDRPGPDNPRPVRPAPVPAGPVKFDRHGDPLPPGAVARYGTARLRHGAEPIGLGFSPDGSFLATVSTAHDGLRTWDPATGKELARLNSRVSVAAFARDGSILVVDDTRARVWIPAANVVRDLPEDTVADGTQAVAVHPDCRSFAAGSDKVRLIDLRTGKHLRELKLPPDQSASRLAYSPDGRWLAGCGQQTGVWLWDLRTGKRVRTYRATADFPEFAFSPDGSRLAVAGERLEVYPTDSEEPVDDFKPPEGQFFSVRFSADGKTLFGTTPDGNVSRIDAATGEAKEPWNPPGGNLRGPFALSPGAALAAAVDDGGGVRVWDPRTGKGPEVERLPLLGDPGFSADGKTVWCLASDGRLHGFDAATGKPRKTIVLPGDETLPAVWDPITRRAASFVAGEEVEVQVLDADAGKSLCKITLAVTAGIPTVSFSAGDRTRAALFCQASVLVVNPNNGKTVRTIPLGKPDDTPPARGAISPDGRLVAVAVNGRKVTLWEVATGKRRLEFDGMASADGAVFSPDGRYVAAWDGIGNVTVFDARLGSTVRNVRTRPGDDAAGVALAFGPDGKRLAVGQPDGTATLWDLATGEEVATLAGHDNAVTGLAFSPDGKYLASTSSDGTALVWEVTGKPAAVKDAGAADGFDDAFRLLGSPDPASAQRGMEYLYRRPAEAARQCGERIALPKPAAPGRIAKLIADLGDEDFPVRQAAVRELEAVGGEAVPELKRAAEKSPDAEVRKLAVEAATKIEASPPKADDLRASRAVEVLEGLATPEAKAVLARWAAAPAGTRIGTEAAAALGRLKARETDPAPGK